MNGSLRIELHPLEPEYGVWCDACLLPSAVTVQIVWVQAETLETCGRSAFTVCLDCGKESS